jgi:hypothetical protein
MDYVTCRRVHCIDATSVVGGRRAFMIPYVWRTWAVKNVRDHGIRVRRGPPTGPAIAFVANRLCDDRFMAMTETLGVLAHRGGLLVERPELSVGVVRAISRRSGVELELLARRPLDRRSAVERQADIRAGRDGPPAAARRLLPVFDEGMDLRVGWLDLDGRPHWEFGSRSSSSGDHFQGSVGPSLRTVLRLPPLFDQVSVVLAWPEIGFPETVVSMPLPDRATVEEGDVSVGRAPVDSTPASHSLNHHVGAVLAERLAVEAGRVVAGPQVLSRGEHAAVVLTRLTVVGSAMSMELLSVAEGETADAVAATAFPPSRPPPGSHGDAEQVRSWGPGASTAVVRGSDAFWIRPCEGTSAGGAHHFVNTGEFALSRPAGGVLDVVVAWPGAGLPDMRVRIPLDQA